MAEKHKRRERSELSRADCLLVLENFSKRVVRFAETSGPGAFTSPRSDGAPAMDGGDYINVSFMVMGSFGCADDLFEAVRVLRGGKLPREE